jgi:hypothetical protein
MIGELFINNQHIDIDEDVIFPITYSIADVAKPETRNRDTTKTISIKGTQNNLNVLYAAYSLSLSDFNNINYDPNAEVPARYERNGTTIFSGVANLLEVVKDGDKYTFEFQLYGESVSLFDLLRNRTLKDLNWGDLDHTLTIANIAASWTGTLGQGYVYGLIHFGYSANPITPQTNELVPYVYAREILTRILGLAGYTHSGFTTSARFNRLVFGISGGEKVGLADAEIAARRVRYDNTGTVTRVIERKIFAEEPFARASYNTVFQLPVLNETTPTLVNDTRFNMRAV